MMVTIVPSLLLPSLLRETQEPGGSPDPEFLLSQRLGLIYIYLHKAQLVYTSFLPLVPVS